MAEEKKYLDKTGLTHLVEKIKQSLSEKADKSEVQPKGSYATLGEDGKIVSSQLPVYVDDIVEFMGMVDNVTITPVSAAQWDYVVYDMSRHSFLAVRSESAMSAPEYYINWTERENYESIEGTPYTGKIYVDTETNKSYRWGGTMLVEVSKSLALGETAETAYSGARGKALEDENIKIKQSLSEKADKSEVSKSFSSIEKEIEDARKKTIKGISVSADASSVIITTSYLHESVSDEDKRIPVVSDINAGVMTPADKKKVDDLHTSESDRQTAERQRQTAEQSRATAEADRTKAELLREAAERKRVTAEQTRTETFNQQTASITTALRNAETATEGAEKVNVELLSDSIRVTNRDGETAELQVTTPQELVTVTVESQVEGLSVEGIKVNVFLNNGKTPQTYTTDAQGEVSFAVDKGNYYEVAVPEYATAQPISPEGYTAVVHQRSILLIYKPYDVDTSEKVIVTVTKYTDGAGVKWEGKVVKIAYDGKTTEYKCDKNGQVATYIPYLKEYTITVDDEDGYLVRFKRNTRTYVAKVAQRLVDITMYQFKTGIFILDKDGNEYYLDEWTGDGKQPDEAVAIKIADQQLQQNRGSFLLRVSDLKDMTKLASTQWCTQNLQFTSIALNGNTSSDPNYWNGEQSSLLVMQEAEERSLSVPAFSKAKAETLEIGGRTLEGFLMSVGQEYVHISNAGVVRDILTALFGEDVGSNYYKFVYNNYRWTSTQNDATNAWLFTSLADNGRKASSYRVLPSFAC